MNRTILFIICLLPFVQLLTSASSSLRRKSQARGFLSTLPKSGTVSSIKQIKNPKWKPHRVSTFAVYAAPFLKYHVPLPANLSAALISTNSPRTEDASKVEPRIQGRTVDGSDGEFVFPVRVGTPSQSLNVIFDTGSGDFWVWSWQMSSSVIKNHRIYNATNSTSAARYTGQSFNIAYASGSVYGTVWQDTVWIDGSDGSIGVSGNPVECAQNIGGAFSTLTAVDGIMGLNNWITDSQSPHPQQTWLNYILSNLAAPVFTVALVQNGYGTMDFGFIDSSKYTGSIAYTPVVEVPNPPATGFWSFRWSGYAIGTQTFNSTSIVPVMTDTGGNLVLLPLSIVQKYYSYVRGSFQQSDGSWCFPCAATLPSFTFGVGKSKITVKSKHMVFAGIADGINCYGAMQATNENGYAYFGTPFFNSLFVVHDYGGHRIGFAARTST